VTDIARPRRVPRADERARGVVVAVAVALGIIFSLLWAGIGTRDLPGDLILYFDYANYVDDGKLPYRDVQVEYPPLAIAPILLAFYGGGGATFGGFEAAFALEMCLLAIAGGWLVWRMLERALPDTSERERRWRLGGYVVAWPLLGQIVTTRFDPLPAVLTIAAVALWLDRRERAAWAVLAIGVATKLFPLVVAPIFAIDLLARRGWRAACSGGLFFSAACVIGFLPGLLLSPDGLRRALTYHSERGIQLESLYASGLLLLNKLTGFAVSTDFVFGGYEAISAWTDELKPLSVLTQLTLLGLLYIMFAWLRTPAEIESTTAAWLVIIGTTLALTTFIISGKVFSPQYLIWLMPFVPLIPGRAGRRAIGVFLLALLLTQVIFPYAYDTLRFHEPIGVALLLARNALMLALAALLLEALLSAGNTRVRPGSSIP
jgi:hypothetical protein